MAFVGATLIDGTGAAPRTGVSIVVTNGRILEITDAEADSFGPEVDIVDAEGRWIVPGFIDTHAHLAGDRGRRAQLQALLDHGITAARSTATATAVAVAVRDSIARGEIRGPTYRVAGALLDGPATPYPWAARVDTPEQVRDEVRRQAEAGVDYIKVYTLLGPELVGAAIEEAHAHDLRVIGHLGRTSWLQAIDLGIDALTHSAIAGMASSLVPPDRRDDFGEFFIPNPDFDPAQFRAWIAAVGSPEGRARELGRRIAERGVVLDPNLVLMDAVLRGGEPTVRAALIPDAEPESFSPHPYSLGWTDDQRAAAGEARELFFEAVRLFHEEGALITAGSDLLNPWMTAGISFHRELELLVEVGLTHQDVLTAATLNGATALGFGEELGSIEVGKRADLVILTADPLTDIRNTRSIAAVYQRGVRVDSGGR